MRTNERGITLIALIIMVILLVILSAVAIRGIAGQDRNTSEVQQRQ